MQPSEFAKRLRDELHLLLVRRLRSVCNRHRLGVWILTICGYELLGDFVLPQSDWWDDFHSPMERRIDVLQENADGLAGRVLDEIPSEIEMYRKSSSYYGYAFFVMKRGG